MTDQIAANAEETTTSETIDDSVVSTQVATNANEETAPQQIENAAPDAEKKQDGVQKKINKEVARRGAAERRADKAERDLQELQSKQSSATIQTSEPVMPVEADFDFDTDKFNTAMSNYHREVAVKATNDTIAANNETAKTNETLAERQKVANAFLTKVDESKIEGLSDKLATLPTFQDDTLDMIMTADNSPELANYLAEHLDVAYDIASSPVGTAGMKLGQIATRLANTKQTNNISNAPDPIDPINQGGAATGDEWDGVGGEASYE